MFYLILLSFLFSSFSYFVLLLYKICKKSFVKFMLSLFVQMNITTHTHTQNTKYEFLILFCVCVGLCGIDVETKFKLCPFFDYIFFSCLFSSLPFCGLAQIVWLLGFTTTTLYCQYPTNGSWKTTETFTHAKTKKTNKTTFSIHLDC